MTAASGQAPAGDKRLSVGPVALLLVSMFFLGVVIWGMFNRPDIRIVIEEVGPIDDFAIGRLVARPEQNLYLIGMDDGRIRALDMRIQETDCIAEWVADDDRGRAVNPGGQPGVFRDPCSTALWSMEGNAIQGTLDPLRTPVVTVKPDTEGRAMRVYVEMINP